LATLAGVQDGEGGGGGDATQVVPDRM